MGNGRTRPGIRWCCVAAAFALAVAGCSSSTPPGDGAPGRAVASDAPDVTQGRLGLARTLADQGNYQAALDVLRDALASAGTPELRRRIQELRLELKRRALAESLQARLLPPPAPVVVGEPFAFEIELTNRGTVPIEIPAADYRREAIVFRELVGKTVLDLIVDVTEFDPRGTRMSEQANRLWEPGEDITLAPGQSWRRAIPLDPDELRPSTMLLKAVTVHGLLRPVRVQVDGRDFLTTVALEPAVAFLLPRGAEAIREDPLRHLELALERAPREPRFLPHVVVAASLLAEDADRERGRSMLVAARDQGPSLVRPSAERALALFWAPPAPAEPEEPPVLFRPDGDE